MRKLILIKLGGSVITNKGKEFVSLDANIIRFAGEIRSALKLSKARLIVGHGAGSFAHRPASMYRTKEGLVNKKSLYGMSVTEESARYLNGIVFKHFVDQKISVYPFSPGSFIISDGKVYNKSYLDSIKKALEIDVVPIVYGDVVLDKKIGFTIFSTEKILSILAKEMRKDYKIKMIFVTDVDGVYDEKGNTIPIINSKNFNNLRSSIARVKGVDVTGGMLHKVEEALNLAKKIGIHTLIINGNTKGSLRKAILGEKVRGTLVG